MMHKKRSRKNFDDSEDESIDSEEMVNFFLY